MKFNQALTDGHREIVQQNLRLVHWTIKEYIAVNESICGLGYDDLYQEGSLALCYAAATYQSDGAQFKTYAVTVIRNHLLDHCRRIAAQRKNTPTISLDRPSREDMNPAMSIPAQLMKPIHGYPSFMLRRFWNTASVLTAAWRNWELKRWS